MKPAPFDYVRATDLDHAIAALVDSDGDGKLLAGGQSLVPLLSMRLSNPLVLVDLGRVAELAYVRLDGDVVEIGSMTRHHDVETHPLVLEHLPLLASALGYVGHLTIRHRGTVGGSAAHGDPAAEVPAVLTALDAVLVIAGPDGRREVPVADFYSGFLTTVLEPEEVLVAMRIPVQPAGTVVAVQEFARRHGDFALAAVFTAVQLDPDRRVTHAQISAAGVGGTPIRGTNAEQALHGQRLSTTVVADAAAALSQEVAPFDDIHAPATYRRHLVGVLTRRALTPLTEPTPTGSPS